MYFETSESITRKVLNEALGTLEDVVFKTQKQRKNIKGGCAMFYKSYEEAVANIISSKLDFYILLEIKKMFTYARVECLLSPTDLSKQLGCTKSKVNKVISDMVDEQMLMRVARGTYRLNPYMVIPFRANGETLQSEWSQLLYEKRELDKVEAYLNEEQESEKQDIQ